MASLALTSHQLAEVQLIAQPLPPDLRGRYLQLVAAALSGHDFGDGDVHRAVV
jgi:hypothetical protein